MTITNEFTCRIQKEFEKRHLLILSLVSTCIFLFVLCLGLLGALVLVGKNLQYPADRSSATERIISTVPAISTDSNSNRVEIPDKMTSKVISQLSFRLPRAIKPLHYELFLAPNLKTHQFNGRVRINISVEEPMPLIALHANKLNITETGLTHVKPDGSRTSVGILNAFPYEKYEYFVIEPETLLAAGNYEIKMNFDGRLDKRIVGFYSSTYYDKKKDQHRTIATSKFEPTYARQSFPSFDEPDMKAKYTISIARPTEDGYIALSNMNETHSEVNGNETIVHFAESVPMSTYLTVFIVADFLHKEATVDTKGIGDPFTLRVFSSPPQVEKLTFALDTAKKVIEYYIQYFGIPYPLPKLDMAAIPDFVSGAMETWGLVTYRETNLLYDAQVSSTANQQRVAGVIAHELAHMWFGNLVTMKWWNDLWLNEGFASYIEYKGMEAAHPEWKMMEQFTIDDMHGVLNLDATLGSHPIVQTVKTPDQITEIFDTITYSKGASVIRMLEDFVGSRNFQLSVTNYLKKFQYKNAITDDLLNEIHALELDFNVKDVMATWTEQMGYPVLNVTQTAPNQFKIEQHRFLLDPTANTNEPPSKFNYRWDVPLTYFTDENSDVQRLWFNREQTEVIVESPAENWIKFNKDQIGYYRVNYEPKMWKSITEALTRDINIMSVVDRAHLLNDAFSLADATQLPFSIALDLTKFLANETSFTPWSVASSKLQGVKSMLYFTEEYSQFRRFGEKLVDAAVNRIDWNVDPTKYQENKFRITILELACSFGHPVCLDNVTALFRNWLSDPANKKPHPDLRAIVYYYGMQAIGNEQIWDQVWDLFIQEQDAQEKVKLMSALSAVQTPWILNRYLLRAFDEKYVRGQDYFSCVIHIAANRNGQSLVWDYVRVNWLMLVDRFGINERYLGRLIPAITKRFSTDIKLQEMKDFFAKYPEAGAGEGARRQALEKVSNNIKWLTSNEQPIAEWLKTLQ